MQIIIIKDYNSLSNTRLTLFNKYLKEIDVIFSVTIRLTDKGEYLQYNIHEEQNEYDILQYLRFIGL